MFVVVVVGGGGGGGGFEDVNNVISDVSAVDVKHVFLWLLCCCCCCMSYKGNMNVYLMFQSFQRINF